MLIGSRCFPKGQKEYIYYDGNSFINENNESLSILYMKDFVSHLSRSKIKYKTEQNQFPLTSPGKYMTKMKFYDDDGDILLCELFGYGNTKDISKKNCEKMAEILKNRF